MCRSLWQTPAAFTLINTCVPNGCGVGRCTSLKGALKSATWKLFIASLTVFLLFGGHCHVRAGETNASNGLPSTLFRQQRAARKSRYLLLGVAALPEQRAGVFTQ